MMRKTVFIVVAAGSGSRFGGDLPKQFCRLGDRPVVCHAVDRLREAGAEVLGVASIFTYGMQKGLDRLAAAGVVNYSLSNLDVLAEVAAEEGYIRPEDKARLIAYRNKPSDESWINK